MILRLDGSGFIRGITPASEADAPAAAAASPTAPAGQPQRLQARIAALSASVCIVARQPSSTEVGHVLAVAAQLES